jgi:hypothetical protein
VGENAVARAEKVAAADTRPLLLPYVDSPSMEVERKEADGGGSTNSRLLLGLYTTVGYPG